MTCKYQLPNGYKCKDPKQHDGLCYLHKERGDNTTQLHRQKNQAILERVKDNGDLVGVIFPKGFHLSPSEITDGIHNDIDMSYADFDDANFEGLIFKGNFKVTNIKTQSSFTLNRCQFEKSVDFSGSNFHGEFQSSSTFNGRSNFQKCGFFGKTSIRGMFNKDVTFNGATFADATTFMGGRDITLNVDSLSIATELSAIGAIISGTTSMFSFSLLIKAIKEFYISCKSKTKKYVRRVVKKYLLWKKEFRRFLYHQFDLFIFNVFGIYKSKDIKIRRVFNEQCSLVNVDFQRPERVSFVFVDFSKTSLTGTNFVGVQFSDVNWYQPSLKRKGIYEETILNKDDISSYSQALPMNEEAYRNIRVSLEGNKDYDTASDFYIGERESHRKQYTILRRHLFSIDAWYNALSKYGTSPIRAFRIIILLILFYIVSRAYIDNVPFHELLNIAPHYTHHVLKLFTLQKIDDESTLSIISWLDIAYRFIIPIMLTLTALSFRSRIKRH